VSQNNKEMLVRIKEAEESAAKGLLTKLPRTIESMEEQVWSYMREVDRLESANKKLEDYLTEALEEVDVITNTRDNLKKENGKLKEAITETASTCLYNKGGVCDVCRDMGSCNPFTCLELGDIEWA